MKKLILKQQLMIFLNNNFWIGLTVFIKAITQLIILKIVTNFYGSSAVGYLGQILSFVTVINSLFSVGLVNFLITELAKYKNSQEKIKSIYGVVSFWCVSLGLALILLSIIFSSIASKYIFDNNNEKIFFIALAAGFIFFNISSVTQGFFSAHKNVKALFFYSLFSIIIGLFLFYQILIKDQKYMSYAVLAFYFSSGLVGFSFLFKCDKNIKYFTRIIFDKILFNKVLKFTSVMAVTGGLGALQQIYMRGHIIKDLKMSWADVGHWQALLKISEVNLAFIGMTMISLYLPSIAVLNTSTELREIAKGYLIRVFCIVSLIALLVQFLAPYILELIYSKDFIFLKSLLKIQMIGDVFKLCSWVFTYFFLAKLKIKVFFLVESMGLLLLTILQILLSKIYSIDGLVYGQVLASLSVFVVGFIIFNFYSKRDYSWVR